MSPTPLRVYGSLQSRPNNTCLLIEASRSILLLSFSPHLDYLLLKTYSDLIRYLDRCVLAVATKYLQIHDVI